MLHGDISNQVSGTIAIQCNGTLFNGKKPLNGGKLLNFIFGNKIRGVTPNERVYNMAEYIYRNTDLCIDIVVFDEDYSDALKEYLLDNYPFNRILRVKGPAQIGSRLLTGDLMYYVDDNAEVRSLVNNKYAISSKQLPDVIRLNRRNRR